MFERIYEALMLLVAGLGVVFTSLLMFNLLISLMIIIDERINKARVSKKLSVKKEDAAPEEKITPEIVAIITAAAVETFHKPIKIKKIHFLDRPHTTSWANTGRLNILGSHSLRRR
ncbi:MAG: OadG family protein [Ignavibacteria bacterium]|jgi:Na+-transporting methylmalonyl-CoA/oxaloacetate decarboxylase gamma subunit|nr:OadG family protein [Ignavibacteria bacterium]